MTIIGAVIAVLIFIALATTIVTFLIKFIAFDLRVIRYLWTRKW